MTDDFALRVTTLLAANPRICEFGCNILERDTSAHPRYEVYKKKVRDGFNTIDDKQMERFRKLSTFITATLHDPPVGRGGWLRIGSYGLKHILERQKWTDDTNTYVSNGEAIVAMMLCGYKPRWEKDNSSPNCGFSVRSKLYQQLIQNSMRPTYPAKTSPTADAVPSPCACTSISP